MVLIHADAFENAESIFSENGQRAIQRDQVRSDRLVVDAHEAHGKAQALLAGQVRLEESHHSLPCLSRAQEQDVARLWLDAAPLTRGLEVV